METIIRHVRDIDTAERHVLEHVIGQQLKENQKVIIQVVTLGTQPVAGPAEEATVQSGTLPEWCNVFEGLTEKQLADVEAVILERSNLTRPSS